MSTVSGSEAAHYWRKGIATRAAFLVDADIYFRSLAEAFSQARHFILISGWDIDSRVELVRGEAAKTFAYPPKFGDLLLDLVEKHPHLEVFILCWNFPFIYGTDREWLFPVHSQWSRHARIHFRYDDAHPIGASHHQKFVIVDDAVAFSGGLDITSRRWDTSEHAPKNPLRKDLGSGSFAPFHDVQMAMEGPVAKDLGELFRERWARAIGERLPAAPAVAKGTRWPTSLASELSEIPVGISLTEAPFREYPGRRDIESLTVAALQSARKCIYIENQYFCCRSVGAALLEILQKVDGPEIVVVLPRRAIAWVEELTMGVLQNRLVKRLKRSDPHGRLGFFYPDVPGLGRSRVNVHSKILIIDDELAKIGSSNLNNRSMGLDSECDVTIEAQGEIAVSHVIAAFRARLLGEHLGLDATEVQKQLAETQSLLQLIREHRGARTLKVLRRRTPQWLLPWAIKAEALDPDAPMVQENLIHGFMEQEPLAANRTVFRVASLVCLVLGIASVWKWAPLMHWREWLINQPSSLYPTLALIYFAAGLVLVPPAIVLLATFVLLGPKQGIYPAFAGMILDSLGTYLFARWAPNTFVRRLVGRRSNEFSRRLGKLGSLPSILLRFLPVAPLTALNLIAGALKVPPLKFLKQCILGSLPLFVALILGEWLFESVFTRWGEDYALALFLGGFFAGSFWLVSHFKRAARRA